MNLPNFKMPKFNFTSNLKMKVPNNKVGKKPSAAKIKGPMSTKQMAMYGGAGLAVLAAVVCVALMLTSGGNKDDEYVDDEYTEEMAYNDTQEDEVVANESHEEPKAEVRNMLTDATLNGVTLEEPDTSYATQPVEQVSYVSTDTPSLYGGATSDFQPYEIDESNTDYVPIEPSTSVPATMPVVTAEPTPEPVNPDTCNHIWINGQTTPATCTKEGSVTAKCKKCGKEMTVALPKTAHQWGEQEVKTEASCKKEGAAVQKCTVCGETKEVKIAALGHDWGDWEITTEPTCQKGGAEAKQCKRCKEKETRTVSKKEHTPVVYTIIKATCEEEGEQDSICSECGKVLGFKITDPLGHDFKETERTPATCFAEGVVKYECSRKGCDATKEKTLKKLTHSYEEVFKAPTCERVPGSDVAKTPGYIGKQCTICKTKDVVDLTVDGVAFALSQHDYQVARTPTKTSPGRIVCKVCGDEINIPALGEAQAGYTYDKGVHVPAKCGKTGDTATYGYTEYTGKNAAGAEHKYRVLDTNYIPKHTPSPEKDIRRFPTANSLGYYVTYCSSCGGVLTAEPIKE